MPTLAEVLRQTGYAQDGTLAAPVSNSPMTTALSEHIKSLPQQFAKNQAEQMALLGQAFPGNTYESMMTEGDPKAMAELAMQVPFNALTAYHGTPHKIKGAFDINKVGTGEGAQAYGHGMYFAESPAVADEYRKNLSGYVNNSKGVLNRNGGDFDKAIEETRNRIYEYNTRNFAEADKPMAERMLKINEKKLEELQAMKAGIPESTGNLYKVDIPDEYIPNMLDWDKPLSQQTEVVQQAIKQIPMSNAGQKLLDKNPNASALYEMLADYGNEPAKASQKLHALGIKGIRYLDEGSRSNYQAQTTYKGKPYSDMLSFKTKGQLDDFIKEKEAEGFGVKTFPQTSNFVVFDPSTVKILEENGKPLSRKELIEKQIKDIKE